MKKKTEGYLLTRILSFVLVLAITLCVLSSCSFLKSDKSTGIQSGSDYITAGDVINNSITINSNGPDVAHAAASGLRSAVSVYCTFKVTTGGNSIWNPRPTTQYYYTTGSGVIYELIDDGSAFIITNHHVVYDSYSDTDNNVSDQIYIYLYGLESEDYAIPATYVGGSANYDIAVLHVDKSAILKSAKENGAAAAVTVADSDKVAPGQTTIAIGNPSASNTDLGGLSVTRGIVSVDSEYITMNASDNSGQVDFRVIRTDTPVNSGNSGGGLFNAKGELIGIVNAKINSTAVENIGYAIPSNVARAIADNIIYHCYGKDCESVMRGMLGVTLTQTGISTSFDTETGVIVRSERVSVYAIDDGSLADSILEVGDILLSITVGDKTTEVTRQYHVIDAMIDARAGESVSIRLLRGGEEMTLSTTVTESALREY